MSKSKDSESICYLINHRPVNWSKKLDQMAKVAGLRCSDDKNDSDYSLGDIYTLVGMDYAQQQGSSDSKNGATVEDVLWKHAEEILDEPAYIKELKSGRRPNINKDPAGVIDFLEERAEFKDNVDDLTQGQKTFWRVIRKDFRAWNNQQEKHGKEKRN